MGTVPTETRIYYSSTPWAFSSASRVILENVHLEVTSYSSGNHGVHFSGATFCTLKNSRVSASTSGTMINGHDNIRIESGSSDLLIQGNYLRGAGYVTINVPSSGCNRLVIEGNTITRWCYQGFNVYGSVDNKYLKNTIDSNSYASPYTPMYLYQEGGNPLVKGNTIKAGTSSYAIFRRYLYYR
jgi:hypothetical protein